MLSCARAIGPTAPGGLQRVWVSWDQFAELLGVEPARLVAVETRVQPRVGPPAAVERQVGLILER
jgi:hypothetical protein